MEAKNGHFVNIFQKKQGNKLPKKKPQKGDHANRGKTHLHNMQKNSGHRVEETERLVSGGSLLFLLGGSALVVGREGQHQLAGIGRILRVQPIVTPLLGSLQDRLRRARMALHVALRVAVDIAEVGLVEQRTIMVVDVLGQLLRADATHAYIQKYSKNLLLVQNSKKE